VGSIFGLLGIHEPRRAFTQGKHLKRFKDTASAWGRSKLGHTLLLVNAT
jgi:hypothetical protein